MPFTKGNPYRIKPKYSIEDMEIVKKNVAEGVNVEDIFALMYRRHPEVDPRTIFNWIEKAAKELA